MLTRWLFAAPLIAHGLAHISGFIASWTESPAGYTESPWIFSSTITLQSPAGRAFGLLWLVAAIGFIGTGLMLVFGLRWWPASAMAASVISLFAIVPWWNTVPPGAKFGAFFDVVVIIVLLLPLKDNILELVS
jgi:uncharacterized membrane protein YphA (DoxX/SURF4 family)